MPDAFLHFTATDWRDALGVGKLAAHIRGQTRHIVTDRGPRAGRKPIWLVDERDALPAALAAIDADERARRGTRGARPLGAIRVLATGPARYDAANGKPLTKKQERAWARAVLDFLRQRLPAGYVIASAVLHRDESSPHVHAILIPYNEATGQIDWRAASAALAGRRPRPRLVTKGLTKDQIAQVRRADRKAASEEMQAVQDAFYEAVSRQYGIGRGDRGARKIAKALDRRETLELDIASARKRLAAANDELQAANKGRDDAERAAREAVKDRERAVTEMHTAIDMRDEAIEARNAATVERVAAEKTASAARVEADRHKARALEEREAADQAARRLAADEDRAATAQAAWEAAVNQRRTAERDSQGAQATLKRVQAELEVAEARTVAEREAAEREAARADQEAERADAAGRRRDEADREADAAIARRRKADEAVECAREEEAKARTGAEREGERANEARGEREAAEQAAQVAREVLVAVKTEQERLADAGKRGALGRRINRGLEIVRERDEARAETGRAVRVVRELHDRLEGSSAREAAAAEAAKAEREAREVFEARVAGLERELEQERIEANQRAMLAWREGFAAGVAAVERAARRAGGAVLDWFRKVDAWVEANAPPGAGSGIAFTDKRAAAPGAGRASPGRRTGSAVER